MSRFSNGAIALLRRPYERFSIIPPTNNRKAVRTTAIIQIDQAARPQNTPKDAVIQIVAAVERPCTTWRPVVRCRITPAPKNPTPVMTPWMTLLASASESFATASTAAADARATSPSVRIPVGFCCSWHGLNLVQLLMGHLAG